MERQIERRRSLPGGRAVVGGLLMAVAAVGVFLAYTQATERPTDPVVVAADAHPRRRGDRGRRPPRGRGRPARRGRLGPPSRRPTTSSAGSRSARSPRGRSCRRASVTDDASAARRSTRWRSPSRGRRSRWGGSSRASGSTCSSPTTTRTASVVRGAEVVQIGADDDGSLTSDREIELVVAVPSGDDVAAVVHALRTGDVTVVRSTFADAAVDDPLVFDGSGDRDHATTEAARLMAAGALRRPRASPRCAARGSARSPAGRRPRCCPIEFVKAMSVEEVRVRLRSGRGLLRPADRRLARRPRPRPRRAGPGGRLRGRGRRQRPVARAWARARGVRRAAARVRPRRAPPGARARWPRRSCAPPGTAPRPAPAEPPPGYRGRARRGHRRRRHRALDGGDGHRAGPGSRPPQPRHWCASPTSPSTPSRRCSTAPRDVVPGVVELVEAHRSGTPSIDDVRSPHLARRRPRLPPAARAAPPPRTGRPCAHARSRPASTACGAASGSSWPTSTPMSRASRPPARSTSRSATPSPAPPSRPPTSSSWSGLPGDEGPPRAPAHHPRAPRPRRRGRTRAPARQPAPRRPARPGRAHARRSASSSAPAPVDGVPAPDPPRRAPSPRRPAPRRRPPPRRAGSRRWPAPSAPLLDRGRRRARRMSPGPGRAASRPPRQPRPLDATTTDRRAGTTGWSAQSASRMSCQEARPCSHQPPGVTQAVVRGPAHAVGEPLVHGALVGRRPAAVVLEPRVGVGHRVAAVTAGSCSIHADAESTRTRPAHGIDLDEGAVGDLGHAARRCRSRRGGRARGR